MKEFVLPGFQVHVYDPDKQFQINEAAEDMTTVTSMTQIISEFGGGGDTEIRRER